jgi:hypothetical protein
MMKEVENDDDDDDDAAANERTKERTRTQLIWFGILFIFII